MFRYIIFSSLFICLFSFKWSLIKTGGSGLRIDDFIIVFISVFSFFSFSIKGINSLPKVSRVLPLFFLYLFICILSSLYNSYIGRVSFSLSLLYSLRNVEYLAFILLGYWAFKYKIDPGKLFKYYVVYAFLLIVLQFFKLVPVLSGFSTNRAIANTGGPWELAAISTFFCVYFFYQRKWAIFFVSTIILVLTQSRITLFSLLIFIVIQVFKSGVLRAKYTNKTILFSIAFLLITTITFSVRGFLYPSNENTNDVGVIDRYSSIIDESNKNKILKIITSLPSVDNQKDYQALTYTDSFFRDISNEGGDASALIRFSRWVILIKSTFSKADSLLLGLGPSFAGLAVDGNYTRIFAETGLLGLFSFILFSIYLFFRLYKNNEFVLFWYYFCLCVTGLFIDVFVTYKAMMLFWFYYGYKSCFRKNEAGNL